MKSRLFKITVIFMAIIIVLTACTIEENNEKKLPNIQGANYDEVLEEGLLSEGLDLQDILYENTIGESKMILFTKDRAFGMGYMVEDKNGWTYSRISPFYGFESKSNPPSPYMAYGIDAMTPDGTKYFLAMGIILNPDITKITLSNDQISAIIKEKDGSIFWFQLLENKDLFGNIKVYDKDGNQLE